MASLFFFFRIGLFESDTTFNFNVLGRTSDNSGAFPYLVIGKPSSSSFLFVQGFIRQITWSLLSLYHTVMISTIGQLEDHTYFGKYVQHSRSGCRTCQRWLVWETTCRNDELEEYVIDQVQCSPPAVLPRGSSTSLAQDNTFLVGNVGRLYRSSLTRILIPSRGTRNRPPFLRRLHEGSLL